MKRAVSIAVLLALLTVTAGWGQNSIVDQLIFRGPTPGAPIGVTATATGVGGASTIYYWVVARYPIGVVGMAQPARATGTRGILALVTSPVQLSWQASAGATGYDVIRLATQQFPTTGTCVACVVTSNQAGTTYLDNVVVAANNWPTAGTITARAALLSIAVNNRDDSYPYFAVNGEFHIMPVRSNLAYGYLYQIGGLMTGTTAQKTYALGINVTRPAGSVATGDSNDALIRGSYSNYAANDANFIIRGINTLVTNRSGGTLGMLDNLISVANRVGGTVPIVNGITVNAENFGVNATQHSAADFSIKNEGAKATKEWGVRVRNLNNSVAGPADAAYLVEEMTLVNTGWNYILDANGVKNPFHAFARMPNGGIVYYGTQTTRDAVRTEVGLTGAIGSLYVTTIGKLYLKVANANATADWQSIASAVAD
jgi:hypothetical protein